MILKIVKVGVRVVLKPKLTLTNKANQQKTPRLITNLYLIL